MEGAADMMLPGSGGVAGEDGCGGGVAKRFSDIVFRI